MMDPSHMLHICTLLQQVTRIVLPVSHHFYYIKEKQTSIYSVFLLDIVTYFIFLAA